MSQSTHTLERSRGKRDSWCFGGKIRWKPEGKQKDPRNEPVLPQVKGCTDTGFNAMSCLVPPAGCHLLSE